MNRITPDMLKKHGACAYQYRKFCREWPDGCDVTLENGLRAAELGLDFDWAAEELLPAPALKAYDEAKAPAWKAYREATATARKAYREARATAWKAYEEAKASAWKAYKKATAVAFLEACQMEAK